MLLRALQPAREARVGRVRFVHYTVKPALGAFDLRIKHYTKLSRQEQRVCRQSTPCQKCEKQVECMKHVTYPRDIDVILTRPAACRREYWGSTPWVLGAPSCRACQAWGRHSGPPRCTRLPTADRETLASHTVPRGVCCEGFLVPV